MRFRGVGVKALRGLGFGGFGFGGLGFRDLECSGLGIYSFNLCAELGFKGVKV